MAAMKKGKKKQVPKTTQKTNPIDIDAAVAQLVNDKLKGLFNGNSPKKQMKRLNSQRDDSDDSEDENPPQKSQKTTTGNCSTPEKPTEYATQVVIITGIDENLKKHPGRLSQAFAKTKPNVEIHKDGLRLTASGDLLVKPKNPKDCNALLKENAFPPSCELGKGVKARLPKSQQITHQVVIRNVDTEVTQEEMEEILERQSLPFKAVKRIHSRERGVPTRMFRLILKDEDTKKKLLRDGINLDQMHYKCIQAIEDTKDYPKVIQCFKCQQLGDHLAGVCPNDQKCVLCSGPHRKADCQATKADFHCANCSGKHAAWSPECPKLKEAVNLQKKPTLAQVASATVTPALLQETLQEIKLSVVSIIAEVVSRCVCELVLEISNRTLSKATLPLKVATISTSAVNAANKAKFGSNDKPIDAKCVKETIIRKCFPDSPSSTQSHSQKGNGDNEK